jgi:hypothetical protein
MHILLAGPLHFWLFLQERFLEGSTTGSKNGGFKSSQLLKNYWVKQDGLFDAFQIKINIAKLLSREVF